MIIIDVSLPEKEVPTCLEQVFSSNFIKLLFSFNDFFLKKNCQFTDIYLKFESLLKDQQYGVTNMLRLPRILIKKKIPTIFPVLYTWAAAKF